MKNYILVLILGMFLASCGGDASSKYPPTELLKYGFVVNVKAPKDAEIKSDDLGVMQEVTINGGKDYNVQILKSQSSTADAKLASSQQMSMVKTDRYFSKVIEEYDNGFIFEKDIDGNINYDFRFIKIIGDQEYIFQTGMLGTYSEEAVRSMYKSVQ